MTSPVARFRPYLRIATVAPALLATNAAAQVGPRRIATAGAAVTIAEPLTVAPGQALAFGLLKGGSSGGTVTVRPEGVRMAGGGAEMVGSGPCHTAYCEDEASPSNVASASYWGPGTFAVRGSPGAAYRVSAPDRAAATLRTPAGGRVPQLVVRSFVLRSLSTGGPTGTLDAQGRDSVRIGGTIDLPPGMKTGSYRVTVPVSVEYN